MTAFAAPGDLNAPGLSPAPANDTGLTALEAGLAVDLDRLGLPRKTWTAPRPGPDGKPLRDVLVIGAGQFGIGVGVALKFAGIADFELLDRAPEGREGPWVTYARMPTLRSPKQLPGICAGIPRLTFQSWYRATHGDAAWDALYKIPNQDWQDYVLWVRRVLALPVRNGAEAVDLRPAADHVAVALADGTTLYAKHVIVATGRAGTGGWASVPGVSAELGPDRMAHTMHDIDFDRLKGKRIAVLGVGASAFDNVATALERGAASVDVLSRRPALPQLNKGRPSSAMGFLEGWQALPDADRWRLAVYLDLMTGVPPHETMLRCLAQPGMRLHFGTRFRSATPSETGVRIEVENGPSGDYDFLLLGTGFRVDLSAEPLFASINGAIRLWRDAYAPPPGMERPHLGLHPYLGDGFELQSRDETPLDRIHLFNAASHMSAGFMALDVPALDVAPERLVTAITRRLFTEDFDPIFAGLQAWEEEHELEPTPFYAPEHVNKTAR
ncbi:NAD(P)-binding domain-containing protein [Marinibacterium sp. SX1]|uniref:NAD(P)-binding domain-containing protein n=1 Tax=Marinibacterium sp. SX1 TaxID=3388424 RepID=UPI003D16B6B6